MLEQSIAVGLFELSLRKRVDLAGVANKLHSQAGDITINAINRGRVTALDRRRIQSRLHGSNVLARRIVKKK